MGEVAFLPMFKCNFFHVPDVAQSRSIAHIKAQDFHFPHVLSSSELQVSKVHLHFNENMSIFCLSIIVVEKTSVWLSMDKVVVVGEYCT